MREDRSFINVLRNVPMLKGLSGKECDALAMGMKTCRYAAGTAVFQEGKPGDSLIIVADGVMSVSVKGKDGKSKQVSRIKSGAVVGEMSCIDPAPRSATVTAVTETLCFELSRTMLQALQTNAPTVASAIVSGVIQQATRRLRDTNEQILDTLKEYGLASFGTEDKFEARKEKTPSAQGSARVDLRKVSTLRAFSNPELKKLVEVAPPRTYRPGTVLCQERTAGTSCFIIAQGNVEVLKTIEGSERRLATLGVGAMVGQISLVDNAPRSATVKTTDNVVALRLERDAFEQLLARQDPLGIRFQEQIAIAGIRQLRLANSRLSTLAPAPSKAEPEPATPPKESRPSPSPRPAAPSSSRGARPEAPADRRPAPRPEPPKERMQLRRAGSQKPPPHRRPDPPARPQRPQSKRGGGRGEQDLEKLTLAYLQTALQEWDLSLNELDQISVVKTDGAISQEELKARGGRVV